MKATIVAAVLSIAALSSITPASAQVTANVNINNNPQILNTGLIQRIQCQRNPRACANNSGSQRTQPGSRNTGNRRGSQQGGQARP